MQFSNFNKTNLDVKACKAKKQIKVKKQVITRLKFRSVKSNTQVLQCKIFAEKNIINIKEKPVIKQSKTQQQQNSVQFNRQSLSTQNNNK